MSFKAIAVTASQGIGFGLALKLAQSTGVLPDRVVSLLLLLFVLTMPAVYWGFAVAANRGRVAGAAVLQETLVLIAFLAVVAWAIEQKRELAALTCLLHGVVDLLHHFGVMPHSCHVPGLSLIHI
eukprot:TRINITY_DN8362_c0_g1_i1.p2 TRINITY_DN8362_c0_g1~~TRINITY_DN8362_c0_g1_i1.p2  ORF type:complete len:125 (-),score=26.11 TRINITY_DN8362_c0_g1_i1:102-476(-)